MVTWRCGQNGTALVFRNRSFDATSSGVVKGDGGAYTVSIGAPLGAKRSQTVGRGSSGPVNKVFRVHKRFPPTNPNYQTQLFSRCDNPNYTLVGTKGQCYVAGYDGTTPNPGGCPTITPVEGQTWTGMKQLFR